MGSVGIVTGAVYCTATQHDVIQTVLAILCDFCFDKPITFCVVYTGMSKLIHLMLKLHNSPLVFSLYVFGHAVLCGC